MKPPHRHRHLQRRHARGFTLLEVLLACTLLVMAVGITSAAIRGLLRGQAHDELQLRRADVRDGASATLRERIAAMTPTPFTTGNGSEALFTGSPTRMEFVAIERAHAGRGGEARQTLEVVPGGDGVMLCLAIGDPRQRSEGSCIPGPQTTMASALKSVRFRYRGYDADGKLPAWSGQWQRTGLLPQWVEITIVPMEGPAWPPVMVRVPLAIGQGEG